MVEEVRPRESSSPGPGRLAGLLPVVLVLWGFVAVYLLQLSIDRTAKGQLRERVVQEMMYFPSGKFMRGAAVEYQHLAADVVWLRAIQYYGYHLMTDQKYEWLGHVFEILTALDPQFTGAYHFGAMTLAWDARKPHEALRLLTNGMMSNPFEWQLPFDAGFICYMLLEDYETAGTFFRIASQLPDAWLIASRWAAVSMAKGGDYETAREMWVEIYRGTENKALRALVVRQLRRLKLDESLVRLQQALDAFREDRGRPPAGLLELVHAGYIDRIPDEPYGGRYFIENGTVQSSTPPSQRQ